MSLLTIALFVLVSKSLCIILPMTKPSGDPDLTSMLNHITLLEQRLEKLEANERISAAEIAGIKADNQRLQYEMTLKNTAPSGGNGNINQHQVSFMAEAWVNQTVERSEVLKFDKVLDNKGNGYKPGSGTFTVPVTGTYIIWAQVLYVKTNAGFYTLTLRKNGSVTCKGYAETSSNIMRSVATINTYVHLNQSDQIWFTNDYANGSVASDNFSRYGALLIREI